MPISAQSRLKVLDNPVLAPGICCLCGSAGDGKRKFIDFGKQLDWFGAVYFCTECFREVAEASDFVPVADFDKLHDELRGLWVKYRQLETKYAPFEEAINNVMESRTSMPDLDFDNLRSRIPESSISEDNGDSDKEQSNSNGESGERESKANESVDVEGPDDLFDSSDFDE